MTAAEPSTLKAAAGKRSLSWMVPFDTEGRQGGPNMRGPPMVSPSCLSTLTWGRGHTGITGTRNKRLKTTGCWVRGQGGCGSRETQECGSITPVWFYKLHSDS